MNLIFTNIRFGHPKIGKQQIDFFWKYLFDLIARSGSNPDSNEIIINGDLFHNTRHTNFKLLKEVKNIFIALSRHANIRMIGNDYCYDLFKEHINKIDEIAYEIKDISLFQFSKDHTDKIGYNIVKEGKLYFMENKFSPRFVEYIINNVDELDEINLNKDFIDVTINSDILENSQDKNRIDIFLNNNQFNNVYYTDQIKEESKVKLDSKNINIRNILIDNIEEELKEELSEVFVIYDGKNNDLI
jgi:hypothetical protein